MAHIALFLFGVATVGGQPVTQVTQHARLHADVRVVVFGATPSGVAAAVAAARTGGPQVHVWLVEPSRWIGGMMAGGLGCTDAVRANTCIYVIHAVILQYVCRACTMHVTCT